MNVGKLTKEELELIRKEFDRVVNVYRGITVSNARATLLLNGYSTPPGHYFDQKLISSGCILASGPKRGMKLITALPKEVL